MNLLKSLRLQTDLTQQAFAEKAGTSQATIAAYESGTKSPTVKTVDRIAASFGLEFFATFYPAMSREDRRSLAFHRAIAEMLDSDPEAVMARARGNLPRLQKLHPHAGQLLDRWHIWLKLPAEDLKALMLHPSPSSREMRQVSPFSGLLSPQQRASVIGRFREEDAA